MAHETCWTLIRAAAEGRGAEREAFVHRYLDPVRGYLAARWRRSPLIAELEDAVQEVFVACFRDGGALERADPALGTGFRVFLFGVARNVARGFERRLGRDLLEPADESGEPLDDEPTCSRIYDRRYARAIMREAAARMAERARVAGPAEQRRVELLRLRFWDGLPVREIARLWGVDGVELHRESAKAGREFKAALREVVGLAERCGNDRLERECDRLLELLR